MGLPSESWLTISTGRRYEDVWVAIRRDGERVCFHTPVEFGFGKELEHLTRNQSLRKHGVVVWDRNWKSYYILARHLHWPPNMYFEHAQELFGTHKITEP